MIRKSITLISTTALLMIAGCETSNRNSRIENPKEGHTQKSVEPNTSTASEKMIVIKDRISSVPKEDLLEVDAYLAGYLVIKKDPKTSEYHPVIENDLREDETCLACIFSVVKGSPKFADSGLSNRPPMGQFFLSIYPFPGAGDPGFFGYNKKWLYRFTIDKNELFPDYSAARTHKVKEVVGPKQQDVVDSVLQEIRELDERIIGLHEHKKKVLNDLQGEELSEMYRSQYNRFIETFQERLKRRNSERELLNQKLADEKALLHNLEQ